MAGTLIAGAATADITPKGSQFLFGYPHVERRSTGVHDPLLSSALYLADGRTELMFVADDIIFVPRDLAGRARERIASATGVPASNIMLTATHTHSGPITVNYLSNEGDPAVPKADENYLRLLEDGIVNAAVAARQSAEPACIGLATGDDTGVGTNRRDPSGPADHRAPVLAVRSAKTNEYIAVMLVCSMHPTVLHEDSAEISGDFPASARRYLHRGVLPAACPVLHHTGPAGNQSPRHVVKANTFAEADRLGEILGRAVARALEEARYVDDARLACLRDWVELPPKAFPTVKEAQARLQAAARRLEELRRQGAARQAVRTAECDWFGAEEAVTLARAAGDGKIAAARDACSPAEIQAFRVGPWTFVGWPGELFIEYALVVKAECPDTFVISLANGELQGYIVTPEAAAEGGYEASNALFGPDAGDAILHKTLRMLKRA